MRALYIIGGWLLSGVVFLAGLIVLSYAVDAVQFARRWIAERRAFSKDRAAARAYHPSVRAPRRERVPLTEDERRAFADIEAGFGKQPK